MRVDYSLLAVNIAGRGRVPALAQQIGWRRPRVVVAVEAQNARDFLDGIPGYRLRQYGEWAGVEAPGVAMLVRNRVPIKWRRLLRMVQPWWFRVRKRKPRRYQKLTILSRRRLWPILAVHFPPYGPNGRNADAWWESWRKSARWLRGRKRGVIVGDLNATAEELQQPVGDTGQLVTGGKVCHVIIRGGRGVARRLPSPNGMHGWALYLLGRR